MVRAEYIAQTSERETVERTHVGRQGPERYVFISHRGGESSKGAL